MARGTLPAPAWARAAAGRAGAYALHALLHGLMALPLAWRGFEYALVRLRHRFPGSGPLAALAAHWLHALGRWRPDDLSRVARLPGGSRLVIAVTDGWHRGIYFRGEYEPETTALFRRFLRPGDVVLDVGANVGYYSCLAAASGARVHAFEPNPSLAERLERTRTLNGFGDRLRINRLAVAAREGSAEFHLSPQANNTGISSLLPLPHLRGGRTLTVPTTTLDAYCAEQGLRRLRLLKIDVEGAELQVLAGAGRVLGELRPDAVICELGGFAEGSRPGYVLRRFCAAGYTPYEMTRDGLTPLDCDPDRIDVNDWPQRNICFLHAEAEPARALAVSTATAAPPAPAPAAGVVATGQSQAQPVAPPRRG